MPIGSGTASSGVVAPVPFPCGPVIDRCTFQVRCDIVLRADGGSARVVPDGVPMTARTPWHGVLVATALPMTETLEVDFDRYGEHVAWLAAEGCNGVTPNGSLGEYQTLSAEERSRVVRTAIEAAPDGFSVMPGIAAYGSRESVQWAEDAAAAG